MDTTGFRDDPEKTKDVLIAIQNIRIEQLQEQVEEAEKERNLAQEDYNKSEDRCELANQQKILALMFFTQEGSKYKDEFLQYCFKNNEEDIHFQLIKEFIEA